MPLSYQTAQKMMKRAVFLFIIKDHLILIFLVSFLLLFIFGITTSSTPSFEFASMFSGSVFCFF